MNKLIKVAVDAMGGDNAPQKIIDGIELHHKKSKNTFYRLFGNKNIIEPAINKKTIDNNFFEIIHTEDKIKGEDTAFAAAKRGKNTSMWLAIESVKNKTSDIIISAGNTGALLIIAKLNLKMIENIDKPALSGLWPSKKGMSVVLDLGANIECSDKNLIDFSIMGSSLFNSLFPEEKAKVALLNIGSEEVKGNEVIKETFKIFLTKGLKPVEYVFYEAQQSKIPLVVVSGDTHDVAEKLEDLQPKIDFNHKEKLDYMVKLVKGNVDISLIINALEKTPTG